MTSPRPVIMAVLAIVIIAVIVFFWRQCIVQIGFGSHEDQIAYGNHPSISPEDADGKVQNAVAFSGPCYFLGDENALEKTADGKPVDVLIQEKTNEFERFRSIVTKKRMEKCPDGVLRKLEEAYEAEAKELPENPECYEFMGSGVLIEKTTGIGPLQFDAPRADQSESPSSFTSMNGLEDTCYCLLCKGEGCPWYKAPCHVPSSKWCIGGYFGAKCKDDRTICIVNKVYMCCAPD